VHEHLTWRVLVGGGLMMTGVYLAILFEEPVDHANIPSHEKITP